MTDRIAKIIQECVDCPDDYDIEKVVAEVRRIALEEAYKKCTYCGRVGLDVLQYIGKIGGSDEPRTITACSDIDACQKRKGEGVK